MKLADRIFKRLEGYDEPTAGLLQGSKIKEVVGTIARKGYRIPDGGKYRFRRRAERLLEGWKRIPTLGAADYAKIFDPEKPEDVNIGPRSVLLDMMIARKDCLGIIGGLNEVVVKSAPGKATSITLTHH
jgi:hypothetical protein